MKTDDSMIQALPAHDRKRSGRRLGAVAAIALLTLSACTSDPGARRVAQDIIKAETPEGSAVQECMLKVLEEDFTDSDLEDITTKLDSANEDTQAEGQALLDDYEAALDACN